MTYGKQLQTRATVDELGRQGFTENPGEGWTNIDGSFMPNQMIKNTAFDYDGTGTPITLFATRNGTLYGLVIASEEQLPSYGLTGQAVTLVNDDGTRQKRLVTPTFPELMSRIENIIQPFGPEDL